MINFCVSYRPDQLGFCLCSPSTQCCCKKMNTFEDLRNKKMKTLKVKHLDDFSLLIMYFILLTSRQEQL